MKINPYYELDCNKVTVAKDNQQIVIQVKATICFSTDRPSTSGLILLNPDALRNASEKYAQLFISQVASSPPPQQAESAPKAQQNQKPPENDANMQEKSASNSSTNPFQTNTNHQYSFGRKEENSSSAQPNFRKNLNVFSTSNQSNTFQSNNQNNSNNQQSNFNFQSNQPPPMQGNMFITPNSQQRPTIFDPAPSVRNSSSSSSLSRTNKNTKARIQ